MVLIGMPSMCAAILLVCSAAGSTIEIDIRYPEDNMRIMDDGVAFDLLLSTACYGPGPECPGSMNLPPWGAFNATYFVYDTDRVGANHWKKRLHVSDDYVGDAFVLITGHANFATFTYSVLPCDALYVHNPYCYQSGVAWKVSVVSPTETYGLTLYPSFGHISGVVDIWATDFFSPELNNTREIVIFKPNSFIQNSLSRPMNVIIVNDGMIDVVNGYVVHGGLDTGMLTGVLPESIMVGVSQPLDNDCQRTYEMTYAPCDPTVSNQCKPDYSLTECYGGNFKYFSFIIDTLMPAILLDLNVTLGEVSIYGFSLGGLTACNAVLDRPDFFSRAMCSSPSFWFNYGDFSKRIRDTFDTNPDHVVPKSVVMTLGTAEDGLYPNMQNPDEYTYWTEFISDVKDSWLAVGLGKQTLAYFTLAGGIHTGISYADDILLESAKSLYQADFPMTDRDQSYAYISYVYPVAADSSGESCSDENLAVVITSVLLGLTWLGIFCVSVYYFLIIRVASPPLISDKHSISNL